MPLVRRGAGLHGRVKVGVLGIVTDHQSWAEFVDSVPGGPSAYKNLSSKPLSPTWEVYIPLNQMGSFPSSGQYPQPPMWRLQIPRSLAPQCLSLASL